MSVHFIFCAIFLHLCFPFLNGALVSFPAVSSSSSSSSSLASHVCSVSSRGLLECSRGIMALWVDASPWDAWRHVQHTERPLRLEHSIDAYVLQGQQLYLFLDSDACTIGAVDFYSQALVESSPTPVPTPRVVLYTATMLHNFTTVCTARFMAVTGVSVQLPTITPNSYTYAIILALDEAGTLMGWAHPLYNVSGDGTVQSVTGSAQSPPSTLSSGSLHYVSIDGQCALDENGQIHCFDIAPSFINQSTPYAVQADASVTARNITRTMSGRYSVFGMHRHNDDVYVCGIRQSDFKVECSLNGAAVSTLFTSFSHPLIALAVGHRFVCALSGVDQSIVCAGDRSSGVNRPPSGAFTQIHAGYNSACAVQQATNSLECWGAVGNEQPAPRYYLMKILDGWQGAYQLTVAIRHADSVVEIWGSATASYQLPAVILQALSEEVQLIETLTIMSETMSQFYQYYDVNHQPLDTVNAQVCVKAYAAVSAQPSERIWCLTIMITHASSSSNARIILPDPNSNQVWHQPFITNEHNQTLYFPPSILNDAQKIECGWNSICITDSIFTITCLLKDFNGPNHTLSTNTFTLPAALNSAVTLDSMCSNGVYACYLLKNTNSSVICSGDTVFEQDVYLTIECDQEGGFFFSGVNKMTQLSPQLTYSPANTFATPSGMFPITISMFPLSCIFLTYDGFSCYMSNPSALSSYCSSGRCAAPLLPFDTPWRSFSMSTTRTCGIDSIGAIHCFGLSVDDANLPKPYLMDAVNLAPQYYYRVGNVTRPCPLGTYSNSGGATSPWCSGPCAAGFFGNTSSTDLTCSGACPLGHYCPLNTIQPQPCPPSTYGDEYGLKTQRCSGVCFRGYQCPAATTSATQFPCASGSYADQTGQVTCKLCQAGKYTDFNASISCVQCGQGKYSNQTGASACTECEAGSSAVDTGSTRCTPCLAGTFSSNRGSIVCTSCFTGGFSNTTGATNCTACDPGSVATNIGSTSCSECSAGTFENHGLCQLCPVGTAQPVSGAAGACAPCAPGTATDVVGSIACQPCANGLFQPLSGSSQCITCSPPARVVNHARDCQLLNCPAHHHVEESSSYVSDYSCVPCPQFTESPSSNGACMSCGANTYSTGPGTPCRSCLSSDTLGLTCSSGQAAIDKGHWLYEVNGTSGIEFRTVDCPIRYCTGSSFQQALLGNTSRSALSLIASQCAYPRLDSPNNFLCGVCARPLIEWGEACVQCDGPNVGVIILNLFITFSEVLFLLITSSAVKTGAYPELLVYFVQTSILEIGPVSSYIDWLDFVNINTASTGKCWANIDLYSQIIINIMIPLILLSELFIVFLLHHLFHWLSLRFCPSSHQSSELPSSSSMPHDHSDGDIHMQKLNNNNAHARFRHAALTRLHKNVSSTQYLRAMASILLFCYTAVTKAVFSYFSCITIGTRSINYKYPAIDCSSSEYDSHLGAIILVLILYVIGLPLATFILVYRQVVRSRARHYIQPHEHVHGDHHALPLAHDHEMQVIESRPPVLHRQQTVWQRVSQQAHEIMILAIGPFYEKFHAYAWYWQTVILLRRAAFVAISVWLATNSNVQYMSFSFLNAFFLLVQFFLKPFKLMHMNHADTASHILLWCISMILTVYQPPFSITVEVVLFLLVVPPILVLLALIIRNVANRFHVLACLCACIHEHEHHHQQQHQPAAAHQQMLHQNANQQQLQPRAQQMHHSDTEMNRIATTSTEHVHVQPSVNLHLIQHPNAPSDSNI